MNTESAFNPDTFLDATVTEASVRRPPLPAGIDLIGTVKEVKARQVQGVKDPSKSYTFMDVQIVVDVPAHLQNEGQPPEITFTDGISLDLTPSGSMDLGPGKNGKLRRYRESLDLNTPGQAFSFRMMIGRQIRVKIKHEAYQGEMYDRIDAVSKV